MNNTELISIIIPVFNSEKYIEECITSVLNSMYHNLEVIVVDDGSTDKSFEICTKIAINDNRVKVFKKKNGGPSDARNYGISKSNGDYLAFVDSDDYVEPNIYSLLLGNLYKSNADISIIGMKKIYENNSKPYYDGKSKLLLSKEKALEAFFDNNIVSFSLCDKLFPKYLFEDIKLDTSIKMCEDQKMIFDILLKINNVYYDSTPCYNIRCIENSLSRNKINTYHLGMLEVNEYINDKTENIKKLHIKSINLMLDNCLSFFVPSLDDSFLDSHDRKRIYDTIKKYKNYGLLYGNYKLKLKTILYCINPQILKNVLNKKRKVRYE